MALLPLLGDNFAFSCLKLAAAQKAYFMNSFKPNYNHEQEQNLPIPADSGILHNESY